MKDDKVLISLLVLAFVLAAAIVSFNVATAPSFLAPTLVAVEEPDESSEVSKPSVPSESSEESSIVFPININTATSAELEAIPDIGPSTANKILEFRKKAGTILEFEEFLAIKGIGEKTVELLKKYCVIE